MARVLLLNESVVERQVLTAALCEEEHQILEATDITSFKTQMQLADIAVIDIDMAHGEGLQAAQEIQRRRFEAGVLIISRSNNVNDEITGLKAFADHYLSKPILPSVFSAYISTMARRFVHPSWELDTIRHHLRAPGGYQEILTNQELALLELLARNACTVVYRRKIATALSNDWRDYDERRLDKMVSRLRNRWRKRSGKELPLRTLHGQGYSFSDNIVVY